MNVLIQMRLGSGCGIIGAALMVGLGSTGAASAESMTRSRPVLVTPWDAAVRARAVFEAEPKGRHTKAEYGKVMDRFRAIYHDEPTSSHAGRAVEQVAELLAEEGQELDDRKAVHDAAKQYEFLAKEYPGVKREEGRGKREEVGQGVGSRKNTAVMERLNSSSEVMGVGKPASQVRDVGQPESVATMGVVTGIRHWSTGTYTRVAIDLGPDAGDDVAYQAVRVKNPDRIFFDLHHVRLAQELAGKTFSVTDEGFLSSIRAAQLAGDSTRVVLDVHEVGEYSAFLLPNPERLIIDIHGKGSEEGRGKREETAAGVVAPVEVAPQTISSTHANDGEAVARVGHPENGRAGISSLPPMPVTDGSAGFGLAPVGLSGTKAEVAQPRVVISSKPTAAKPVPNTVVKSSVETGTDVAAVSEQPGRVAASRKPTTLPVASSSRRVANGAPAVTPITLGIGDHYRSPKAGGADSVGATPSTSQKRDIGHPALSADEAAEPTADAGSASSETTLMRALGLKIGRIVIDAGHGGHDSGTLGAGGIQEKDVVLDVALRLGKLLHDRLGAEIVYTRADDTFIPLETRTAIANKAQADLFISVHANSSPDASARGVEVYYLNFTSDPDAMKVASRENAVSTQSVHELSDLVKKIALKDKIDESRELAADVDASLYGGLTKGNAGLKDRGVKKAPFVVLIGANMPSILAEISFVTNPQDADQLETDEYRERVAESLYKGVAKYAAGINKGGGGGKKQTATERAAR